MNILTRLRRFSYNRSYSPRRLPAPSKSDLEQLAALRAQIDEIEGHGSSSTMAKEWDEFSRGIVNLIKTDDARNFLNWEIIRETMFFEAPTVEFEFLTAQSDWNKWRQALIEPWVGNPKPYFYERDTSGNAIHHAYTLAHFLQLESFDIPSSHQIIEFGGGYGSMCRIIRNLGFKGRYIIFDLSVLNALQEYYLHCVDAATPISRLPTSDTDCVILLNDIDAYQQQLVLDPVTDVYIANWSMSETPLDLRNAVLAVTGNPANYLLSFQSQFGDFDNVNYFQKFRRERPNYNWYTWEIEHIKGNYYQIGISTLESSRNRASHLLKPVASMGGRDPR